MPNRVNVPAFSPWLYKQCNTAERCFNKLKHFRAIATRYDKRDDNFLASIQLASMRIWLRSYESVTYSVRHSVPNVAAKVRCLDHDRRERMIMNITH